MSAMVSGKAPFTVSSNGALAETFFMVFGDLRSAEQVPLVVGHGGGGTHHYLKSLSQLTEENSIPIILYDQIGFGLSSHFPDQAGNTSFWTVSVLAEQLHELIKYLGIEKGYNYLGHSFGTVIGIELSSQPALRTGLRKLILWSPVASMKLADEMFQKRREMLPKGIRKKLEGHEANGTTDSKEYKKAMTASQHHNFCRLEVWPDELLESLSYSSKDGDAALTLFGDSPLETKGSVQNWSALKTAYNITVPTLLLNGHYDWSDEAMTPLFWAIPFVRWVTFSNSSHLLHFEEKERFMNMVSTWLTRD
ncbi:proline-specific peptidase [Dendrothele bispora CBS 962.96]|uniref:Proline-specific peptidase n=1 Tax=Dendrothele bispora (strain CBS 962.96) TaxID=1314807 RepID=A0A4S8KY87_DENBC|nr:proline-specific peptidase [Dendrothele bispora CBS 962.96]